MAKIAIDHIIDETMGVLETTSSKATNFFNPTIRLGVTGLSRSGKTVFITSLVQNLLLANKLPMFSAFREGRITQAYLNPQPDDDVPRFALEDHIDTITGQNLWPNSTRSVSQLRITLEFETNSSFGGFFRDRKLNVDIVDYPGEWLLDLPLLSQTYREFSQKAIELANTPSRKHLSQHWLKLANELDFNAAPDEPKINALAAAFAQYLRDCKDDKNALSNLPPGRFLLPGDLEGSPALTYAPLPNIGDQRAVAGSLLEAMERRFESYKSKVIRPFYHNHFARIDRQIILIDALQALNAGRDAVVDLERALSDIMLSFNAGRNRFPENLFKRKIDKVLIAATKADHLHHEDHKSLERIVSRLVERARKKHVTSGAEFDVLALASLRATTEAKQNSTAQSLPLIVGTPMKGQRLGKENFDGETQKAIFPGDLPEDIDSIFQKLDSKNQRASTDELLDLNFIKFRPQADKKLKSDEAFPHIRLDRAIQFLLGDRLQ